MVVAFIAAMTENRVIGRDGGLPWRLPADMRFFMRATMGHAVILGRATFESMDGLLPGRRLVIVTRRPDYAVEGARVVHSLEEALRLGTEMVAGDDDELFVAGGGEIFRQALPRAERLYLTVIHTELEGDTFFPEIDGAQWELVSEEPHPADERHAYPFTFRRYERRAP